MLRRPAPEQSSRQVTFVANDVGGVGGMEQQNTRLIEGMLRLGWDVTVISWTCALEPHPRLRWVRVPGPRRPFSLAMPIFFVLGSLVCRMRGRGLVHANGAVIANRVALTTVHFCHRAFRRVGVSRASRPNPLFRLNSHVAAFLSRLAEAWCYRPSRTSLLVAVSRGLAEELRSEFPEMRDRLEVVPNGVDTTRFAPDAAAGTEVRSGLRIDAGAPVAVFVGGDWERKGLRFALEAVAAAAPWHLLVVGDGDRSAYERLARARGSAERVRFVGRRAQVSPYLSAATAFLLPTAYETFSLVTYEAAASGLPLLVTKVNGVNEILEDGVTGWFIQRRSADIATKLRELHGDRERRAAMGARARQAARRYDWQHVVDRYDRLYELAVPG